MRILEDGPLLYEDKVTNIGFGILKNGSYLVVKGLDRTEIKNDNQISIGLLPLLQLDVSLLKKELELKGLDFFKIVPVERIVLAAFDDGFGSSIFWKELALTWIEKLKYLTPTIVTILEEKSSKESNLPKDFKFKIKKVIKKIR